MVTGNQELKAFYLSMQGVATSSVYNYLLHINSFLQFSNKSSRKLKSEDFHNYMNSIEIKENGENTSQSYRASVHTSLKKYAQFLMAQNILDVNPMEQIPRPKTGKNKEEIGQDDTFLTKEEIKHLIQSVKEGVGSEKSRKRQLEWKERDLAIVLLLLETGLKSSELLKLDIDDIDENKRTIKCNNKKYDLSEEMQQVLTSWILKRTSLLGNQKEKALFVSNRRNRLDQGSLNRLIGKYSCVIEGKTITPEVLRTTYGIHLFSVTQDVSYVKKALGLNNPLSVFKYLKKEQPFEMESAISISNILTSFEDKKNKEWADEYPINISLIARAKDSYWEYILFGEAMSYQYENKLFPYRKKASFDLWKINNRKMELEESKDFMMSKLRLLGAILSRYSKVTNGSLRKGMGEPERRGMQIPLLKRLKNFQIYIEI